MSDILACRRGTVITIAGCQGIPGTLSVDGFDGKTAIIVAPMVNQMVNIQFQTSLREAVYAYVFGDRMGAVNLQGLAFAQSCDGGDSGLKELFDYYNDYRASQRTEVVTVTIADEAFSGFLTAMTLTPKSPEHMISAFTLQIHNLPKKGS